MLEVSFLDLYFVLAFMFYLLSRVPVEAFNGFALSLLASVIDLIDLVDLLESSEHLLLLSNGSGLSLDFSYSGTIRGSGLCVFWVLQACWISFFRSVALFLPRISAPFCCCILTNNIRYLIHTVINFMVVNSYSAIQSMSRIDVIFPWRRF
jgi:hypothetical protein